MINLEQLTKKNQEFIHIATKQLIKDGKDDTEIKEILESIIPTLLDNQKKGYTARTLLGAPTAWAASFSQPASKTTSNQQEAKNTNPWLMWLDTSLLFLALFAGMNGAIALFQPETASYGFISLLALAFAGGGAMYATYYFVYRHMGAEDKSQIPSIWKRLGILFLVSLAWILIFSLTSLLPANLNPTVPAMGTILIAIIALTAKFFLQRKYNILNSLSPVQR